jgi:hypothetical protein
MDSNCWSRQPLQTENRGFRTGVRRSIGDAVGRDAQAGKCHVLSAYDYMSRPGLIDELKELRQ